MGIPLRVLIIEDSPDDAVLMLLELRRSGYDATSERIETADALRAALDAGPWDAILSDYSLPNFSAPAALRLVQEMGLDIPFIIVSGTVGEDVAVAAMKAGAHDFFPKDKLARLVPALEREIREAAERRHRRRAVEQLRESEERFAKAFQASPVGIAISGPDERFLDVNEHALRLFEYTHDEVIGRTSVELGIWANPEDRVRIGRLLRERGSVHDMDVRCRTKSGGIRDVLASFETIKLADEDCVLTLFQDITARKQAEEELAAIYNATSFLFKADSLPHLAHQIVEAVIREFGQVDCGLMLVDRRQNRMIRMARSGNYGVETDAPLRLDGPGLVPRAARMGQMVYVPDVSADPHYVVGDARTRSELVVPLKTTKALIATLDLQRAELDGFSERDQRILSAFAERAAAAIEIMQLYDEINRHAAELEWRVAQRTAELVRSKEHVETILNNSSDAIILIDSDGMIQQANPAFGQMFGFTGEIWGRSLMAFLEPSEREKRSPTLLKLMQGRQPARLELACVRADGTVFDADAALAPLAGASADELRIICSLRDMSERKQLESELREALAKEKELNELKSRFVSMVSHEFRTPLAAILSSAELVRNYRDRLSEERQLEHLEKITFQVRRLAAMMDDVLTIGKADTKGIPLNPERLNLATFCKDVMDEIRLTASGHEIQFAVNGDYPQADIDTKLMRQVLYNLLSNAVKYSPKGGTVRLDLTCNQDTATIRISDQGIGIPEHDLKRLFEPFHRARNVSNIQGTGLGLAIVKQSVEAHGGAVGVVSEVDKGTTFTVTLPLFQPAGAGE